MDRKQWIYYGILRAAELAFIVLLVVVIFMISQQVKEVRREVAIESLNLESNLASAVEQGVLQAELDRRGHDIERLKAMLPERDNIDVVIEQMENEARERNLVIQIPVVASNVTKGNKGEIEKPLGVLQEVRVSVVVSGGEREVMEFWHEIEHLAYLTGVVDFDLVADNSQPVGRNTANNPSLAAPDLEAGAVSGEGAKLTLQVLVSTRNNE